MIDIGKQIIRTPNISGLPNFKCSGRKELAAKDCDAIPIQARSQRKAKINDDPIQKPHPAFSFAKSTFRKKENATVPKMI
tara:strand:- start:105 stop:344 length:240 start_codon:yes stop_codon:yes gene_type:complete